MKEFIKLVEEKIKQNSKIEKIKIIDNSHKHVGHKSFVKDRFHLTLEIQSKQLSEMNKIDAQRKIMETLKEELKSKIHALEIKII